MRVAAVDCGTNSIRLLVADVNGGSKHDVHREMRIVRLGEGVDRTGRLSDAALGRTREALEHYASLVHSLECAHVRMVATSASRDASNSDVFVAMVEEVLGTAPEVVSGDEEAALSFDGATRELDPAQGPFLVADIGGGSTELVLGTLVVDRMAVTAARSVDVGCVRLTERHLHDDPPTAPQVAAAEADVDAALALVREVVPVEQARTFLGLAGSVTTVGAHVLGLQTYDAEALHLARLPAADVVRACTELLEMPRAERRELPYVHAGRVDVIGAGALVLRTLVDRLGLTEVVVSEADILDGIAWSCAPGAARP